MSGHWRYIAFIVFLCSLCTAGDQGRSVTHREIFFRMSDSVMTALSKEIVPFRSVVILAERDTFGTYFHPLFRMGLVRNSVLLFSKVDSAETTLELTVRESSVFYGEPFTESFFGSSKNERRNTLLVTGTLFSASDGRALWTKDFACSFSDTIFTKDTEHIENGIPPLTSIVRPDRSLFDFLIEPAIITIASGVAIYLFFTIRS
jgi:hypothetical protein